MIWTNLIGRPVAKITAWYENFLPMIPEKPEYPSKQICAEIGRHECKHACPVSGVGVDVGEIVGG